MIKMSGQVVGSGEDQGGKCQQGLKHMIVANGNKWKPGSHNRPSRGGIYENGTITKLGKDKT